MSKRRITATSYLDDSKANTLLERVLAIDDSVDNIMFTLVCSALSHRGLLEKSHVQDFLRKYSRLECLSIGVPQGLWDSDKDILGFVYQSLITEGERNVTGQYYTCEQVVRYILKDKSLSDTETFLDPCCGSGAFLMAVKTDNPANLYGFDINSTAVMIASANLLLTHSDKIFRPNIYCLDFLCKDLFEMENRNSLPQKFDNIYTNPPWGSDKEGFYVGNYPMIVSRERASMVIVEALSCLNEKGTLYSLLPTSLLKIKSHGDIRKYILSNSKIKQIDLYKGRFDGVFTDYFGIKVQPGRAEVQNYNVVGESGSVNVVLSNKDRA
ncbi:MAG: class I SAM-dependent DNA methyltransferase, partial [Bacteroidaceae bacterium]